MKSIQANLINFYLKYLSKPYQTYYPINSLTMKLTRLAIELGLIYHRMVPRYVKIKRVNANGTRAEWVNAGDEENKKVVVYLHGGGYFAGSSGTHRPIIWRLSKMANVKVLSLDYRMLPEYSLEDCWRDVINAYKWLLHQGYEAHNIAIGGDSAGGGLTLSVLLQLRDKGLPLPCAAFLISPFADITGKAETIEKNARDDIFFHKNMVCNVQKFIRKHYDPMDYRVSPVFGNYENLPPLFIQTSDSEVLYDDSRRIKERAEESGIKVSLNVWKDMPHVFAIFSNFVPESREGIDKIASFIKAQLNCKS